MENASFVIETALLLLVAFLVGCLIGYYLRRVFDRDRVQNRSLKPFQSASANLAQPDAMENSTAEAQIVVPASPRASVPPPVSKPATPTEKQKPQRRKAVTVTTPAPVDPAPAPAIEPETTVPEAVAAETQRPAALSSPREGGKDDLKKIKGIGPKIENTLNGIGIFHYDQIAAWTLKEIAWVDDHLSFRGRIDRENWVSQARELGEKSRSA